MDQRMVDIQQTLDVIIEDSALIKNRTMNERFLRPIRMMRTWWESMG